LEDQTLTSFPGLVIFQKFFASIDLKSRLRRCFKPLRPGKVFHPATVFLRLIVYLLLGFCELQDCHYYREDPLVQGLLGLRRLATVATVSRVLKQATAPKRRRLASLPARQGVEFTISVPFERFVELKKMIEQRRRWRRVDGETHYFQTSWKPQCWDRRFRFVFIRTRAKQQQKGPIQLDLFEPYEYGYEFKMIVTNKTVRAKRVAAFHEGRGSQEGVFAELRSHCHLDYVPVRTLYGNQTYLLAGLFAYNLTRERQMQTGQPARGTTAKRTCLWVFEEVDPLRKTLLHCAGRLSRPQGHLTLTLRANSWIKTRLLHILDQIPATARPVDFM